MSSTHENNQQNSGPRHPNSLRVAWVIGKVTFFEVVRDKLLYNSLVVAALLMSLGFLASRLTFVRPDRIVVDFGLSAVAISLVVVATLIGSTAVLREIERRTINVALSHPISRLEFVVGKFTGVCFVLVANWVLLVLAYLAILWIVAPTPELVINKTLLIGAFLALLQSVLVAAIAVVLSCFSTMSLAIIMTTGLFLIGHNISQIRLLAARVQAPLGKLALKAISSILPNFEHFNLNLIVTYGLPVPKGFLFNAIVYSLVISIACLILAGIFIRSREL